MASSQFKLETGEIDRLQTAIKKYAGNAEAAINDVLHNISGRKMQDAIYNVMPQSNRKAWGGKNPKKKPAKTSKSLQSINSNLAVTVTTTKNYQYLYFPDDGTNTRRHAGNQQFFKRGGESVREEIIDLCIAKLTSDFENAI